MDSPRPLSTSLSPVAPTDLSESTEKPPTSPANLRTWKNGFRQAIHGAGLATAIAVSIKAGHLLKASISNQYGWILMGLGVALAAFSLISYARLANYRATGNSAVALNSTEMWKQMGKDLGWAVLGAISGIALNVVTANALFFEAAKEGANAWQFLDPRNALQFMNEAGGSLALAEEATMLATGIGLGTGLAGAAMTAGGPLYLLGSQLKAAAAAIKDRLSVKEKIDADTIAASNSKPIHEPTSVEVGEEITHLGTIHPSNRDEIRQLIATLKHPSSAEGTLVLADTLIDDLITKINEDMSNPEKKSSSCEGKLLSQTFQDMRSRGITLRIGKTDLEFDQNVELEAAFEVRFQAAIKRLNGHDESDLDLTESDKKMIRAIVNAIQSNILIMPLFLAAFSTDPKGNVQSSPIPFQNFRFVVNKNEDNKTLSIELLELILKPNYISDSTIKKEPEEIYIRPAESYMKLNGLKLTWDPESDSVSRDRSAPSPIISFKLVPSNELAPSDHKLKERVDMPPL